MTRMKKRGAKTSPWPQPGRDPRIKNLESVPRGERAQMSAERAKPSWIPPRLFLPGGGKESSRQRADAAAVAIVVVADVTVVVAVVVLLSPFLSSSPYILAFARARVLEAPHPPHSPPPLHNFRSHSVSIHSKKRARVKDLQEKPFPPRWGPAEKSSRCFVTRVAVDFSRDLASIQ